MISLARPPRENERFHQSVPEVRALRPGLDESIGARLDRLARAGVLNVHRGRVNRLDVYRTFRISQGSANFLGVANEHFERHDRLLAEAGVPERKWEGLPERITAFLETHLAAGTLVRKRKGHGVCRDWIAEKLEFPKELFVWNKAARDAVLDFNAALPKVGLQETGKHRDLHLRMAQFLEEGWEAGTLKLGPGGVDRLWLAKQFGVLSPTYLRYPKTRAVVDAFDASIRDKLAESPTYPTLAADLRALLAELTFKGELPVFKDRLNETELARRLSVAPTTFQLVPECIALLDEARRAVRHDDPVRPFHEEHGRNYSFHDLVAAYGTAGAAKLAARFCEVAGPAAPSAKQQYRLLLEIMARLSGLLSPSRIAAIGAGRLVRGRPVEAALRQWRSDHLAGAREPHILSSDIVTARALLERMGLFGDATEVLVRVPNAGAARPKRSLAEAQVRQADAVAEVVAGYARDRQLDYDAREVEAFVSNLALAGDLADVSVDDLPEAIRKLNRERIDRILACALLAFKRGVERHRRGLELLERGRAQAGALDGLLAGLATGGSTKRDVVRFFTQRDEEGLCAFLFHVERDHGGLLPRSSKGKENAEKVFHSRIVTGLGGQDTLEGLLHLPEESVAAACLIYICESGANGAVGRGLQVDCLRPSTVPGHREVAGWKERTGRPIVTDLPASHRDGAPSAVEVLEAMQDAHPRLARLVDEETARHLFLTDTVGRVQPVPEHRLLHLLREIAKADPALGEFHLRVDMIRSSVLLDAALSADGNISVANAIANHASEDMTAHYVLKMPLRIIYERKIREFQNAFEAVVLENVEGAAERLGMAIERIGERFADALPTGLGRMCLKPTAGIQPGTAPGETCQKLQACASCKVSVVVADVDLVTDLVIWHGSLVEAAEGWPPEREEHFAEHWLDDLAFCDAALAALGRGPHVRILRKARDAAKVRLAQPDYERPRPW